MVKRIICFLCALIVFIFNCCPVFAAVDAYTSEHFLDIYKQYMVQDRLDFINSNLSSAKYHAFILDRDFGTSLIIFKSSSILDYEFLSDNTRTLTITNNSDEDDYLYSIPTFHNGTVIPAGESITWDPAGYGPNFRHGGLLIVDGNCVNETYCSADVFVNLDDITNPDDYVEGNVSIKGLTGFFKNMIAGLGDVKDAIVNLPETIINGVKDLFIPDIEVMKADFTEFIEFMNYSLGFGPLIDLLGDTFSNIDEGTISTMNFQENFTFNLNGSNLPLSFSLPFSDYLKGQVHGALVGYLKGFFYFLLILYNLNEIYMLIRGTRLFKDRSTVVEMNIMEKEAADLHRKKRLGKY